MKKAWKSRGKPACILCVLFAAILLALLTFFSGAGLLGRFTTDSGSRCFSLDVTANYRVTFDANGGWLTSPLSDGDGFVNVSDNSAEKILEPGASYGTLPTAKRTGYTFTGWSTSRLPEGFQEVEYLESHGNEYIDSAYYPRQNTFGFNIDLIFYNDLSGTRTVMSVYDTWNASSACFGLGGNYQYFCSECRGWTANTTQIGSCLMPGTRGTITTVNNGDYDPATGKSTYTVTSPLLEETFTVTGNKTVQKSLPIFAGGGNGSVMERAHARIYRLQLLECDTPVRDFVPAVWLGGETTYSRLGTVVTGTLQKDTPGFYDLTSDIFYINSGTGAFTTGEPLNTGDRFISEESTLAAPEDRHFLAIWKAQRFTLTLDANDGETPIDSLTVTYDETYEKLPVLSRRGYEFNGWFDENGTLYRPEDTVKITEDTALRASWTGREYQVRLIPNGGTVSPDEMTVTFGEPYGDLPTPERTGYTFKGWHAYELPEGFTKIEYLEGTGTQYINTGYRPTLNTFGLIIDATFINDLGGTRTILGSYDNWTSPSPCFTMGGNYKNLYGGHNKGWVTGDGNICPGSFLTPGVRGTVTIRNLGDYSTSTNISTISLSSAIHEEILETVTGTAAARYPLVLFGVNGAGSIGEMSHTRIYSLKLLEGNNEAYDFIPAIWQGGEVTYSKGGTVTTGELPENTAGLFDLVSNVFYINSGTGSFSAGTIVELNGEIVTSTSPVAISVNHGLYAEWEVNRYEVTFNPNGGVVSPATKTVSYGEPYGELPIPTRTGYTFSMWAVSGSHGESEGSVPGIYEELQYIESTGKEYIDTGYAFASEKAEIRMAVSDWLPNEAWSVFYGSSGSSNLFSLHGNYTTGGVKTGILYYNSGATGNKPLEYNLASLKDYTEIRDHRENGVLTLEIGNSTLTGAFSGSMKSGKSLYLFAYHENTKTTWYTKFRVYYFKVYDNGALVRNMVPVRSRETGECGLYDLVSKAFYGNASAQGAFAGGPAALTEVTAETCMYELSDHTLHAVWVPNAYTITLRLNDSEGSTRAEGVTDGETETVTYDSVYSLPTPSREGYDFAGWIDEDGNAHFPGEPVKITKDSTFMAGWSAKTFEVIFVPGHNASVSPERKTVTFDAPYGDLPVPVREGFVFRGWVSSAVPTDYTALEYIENTGTQYINTGYVIASENVRVRAAVSNWSPSQSWSVFYGAATSGKTFSLHGQNGGNINFNSGGIANNALAYNTAAFADYTEIDDTRNAGSLSLLLNETSFSKTYSGSVQSGLPVYLFAYDEAGSTTWNTKIRVYYFDLYDGGELVRSLIPVKENETGAVGMYDTVTKHFYESASGASFTGGPATETASEGAVTAETPVSAAFGHTLYAMWEAE